MQIHGSISFITFFVDGRAGRQLKPCHMFFVITEKTDNDLTTDEI